MRQEPEYGDNDKLFSEKLYYTLKNTLSFTGRAIAENNFDEALLIMARKDLRADKENNTTNSTASLNEFCEYFIQHTNPGNLAAARDLATDLAPSYNKLKKVLAESRVLGVGNDEAAMRNTLKGIAKSTFDVIAGISIGYLGLKNLAKLELEDVIKVTEATLSPISAISSDPLSKSNAHITLNGLLTALGGFMVARGIGHTDKIDSLLQDAKRGATATEIINNRGQGINERNAVERLRRQQEHDGVLNPGNPGNAR